MKMNMVNTMKIKFIIRSANDNPADTQSVSFLFTSTTKDSLHNVYYGRTNRTRNLNQYGEYEIETARISMVEKILGLILICYLEDFILKETTHYTMVESLQEVSMLIIINYLRKI